MLLAANAVNQAAPVWLEVAFLAVSIIGTAVAILIAVNRWGAKFVTDKVDDHLDSEHAQRIIKNTTMSIIDTTLRPELAKIHKRIDDHMAEEERDLKRVAAAEEMNAAAQKAQAITMAELATNVAYLRGRVDATNPKEKRDVT